MPAVSQQHVGPEPVEDLLDQLEEDRRLAGSGDRSARLDTVGMSVTCTPLTLRSITLAALPIPSSAWNLRAGSSRVANTSSSDVSRSGSRIPVVSTRQSIPRPASSSSSSRVHKAAPLEGSS